LLRCHSKKSPGNTPGLINTLAQRGTAQAVKKAEIIRGKGTEISIDNPLHGKARRKTITQSLMPSFVDVVRKKGDMNRLQQYWNTYHCQSKLIKVNGRLYGSYCKNRFCNVCSSIRKAKIMNRYLPTIDTWEEPYFVTITAKSVPAKSLAQRMSDMNRGFRKISSKLRKRNQRGTGIKLVGIKSLECNFNPIKKTYNPHLHLIVANKEMADILKKEWLALCTAQFASPKGQHSRRAKNTKKDVIEVVKYCSKTFTQEDVAQKKGSTEIYTAAMDNIYAAMKGLRIFDRFGFNPLKEEKTKMPATLVTEYEEFKFNVAETDWIEETSGNKLTSYQVPQELKNLLLYNINTEDE
jgi:hypothetical protein